MKRFLIPSLLAAGLLPRDAVALPEPLGLKVSPPTDPPLFEVFRLEHLYTLAAHRSHSSHSSHRSHSSHSSHRSGVPGGYVAPRAAPPAPSYVAPAAPAPLVTLPGNSDKFRRIVIQVQTGLQLYGYPIVVDGAFGPATKAALLSFQRDWKLPQTGTITPEVLDALGIAAR